MVGAGLESGCIVVELALRLPRSGRMSVRGRQMCRDAIGGETPFKENYALLKKLSEM